MSENKTPEPIIVQRSQHCLSRKNIDPEAQKVMYRLCRNGFKAYMVGGSVRDLLLGKTPKDFDISTDARPGDIKKLFRNCRIIGRRFRLAHVFFQGNKIIEVATFRRTPEEALPGEEELPEDQRRGDNTFGEPHEDAMRRDLTINGLFYDIESFSIIDYVGGVEDLREGVVRTIGDPEVKFREDPLRMIRAARHAVQAGFRIEENTFAAILRCAPLLKDANSSRLQDDVQKDLHRGFFASILRLQMETGILNASFPDLDQYLKSPDDVRRLLNPSWVWEALTRLDAADSQEDRTRRFRLASLFFPLLEERLLENADSTQDSDLHGGQFHLCLPSCCAPMGICRREREEMMTLWSGWLRLQACLASGRVPMRFQDNPHFEEICAWHLFWRSIKADSTEDAVERIEAAVTAGRIAGKRRRRRRRKPRSKKPISAE